MILCVQGHVHVTGQEPVHAYGDYHVCVRACLHICIHVLVCARAGEIKSLSQGGNRHLAGRGSDPMQIRTYRNMYMHRCTCMCMSIYTYVYTSMDIDV